MNKKNIKVGSVYLTANIINKAVAFVTVPIFTRLLTTGEYGIVSTYLSFVSILQYFMGLSSEYTIRNAYVDYRDDIIRYMSSVYTLSLVCNSITALVVIVINQYLNYSSLVVCILCLVHSYATFVINAMSFRLMMDEKHYSRSLLIAGPNVVSAILGLVLVFNMSNERYIGRILGYVVSYVIFAIWCICNVFVKERGKLTVFYWKYILGISPPLIIHGLSLIILSQIDRIMLSKMRTTSETGIYSIIYTVSMIALAITQALESIWTPWFTVKYAQKEYNRINERACKYLLLAAALMTIGMLVSPEVIELLTPKDYWSGIPLIPPLVGSCFLIYSYSYYVGLELQEKVTKTISIATLIATGVNVVLNLFFIPLYGAIAAACTTIVSYTVLFIIHSLNGRRLNREIFNYRCFVVPGLMIVCSTVLFYLLENLYLIRWGLCIVVFFSIAFLFSNGKINLKHE